MEITVSLCRRDTTVNENTPNNLNNTNLLFFLVHKRKDFEFANTLYVKRVLPIYYGYDYIYTSLIIIMIYLLSTFPLTTV